MRPLLTIVMPAYNEEQCIGSVVTNWSAVFGGLRIPPEQACMVVVNDGSRDKTGKILDGLAKEIPFLKVVHQTNAGHGAALMRAYQEAIALESTWIFHVDSDDQFLPSDLVYLWAGRGRSKFILGYRRKRQDALHRLVITRIAKGLNLFLFGTYIPDANIPFRLIQGPFLKTLIQVLPRNLFAPNIFLSLLAARTGQDTLNIAVNHQERMTGTVSILRLKLLKVCLRTVKELFDFRITLVPRLQQLAVLVARQEKENVRKVG